MIIKIRHNPQNNPIIQSYIDGEVDERIEKFLGHYEKPQHSNAEDDNQRSSIIDKYIN